MPLQFKPRVIEAPQDEPRSWSIARRVLVLACFALMGAASIYFR